MQNAVSDQYLLCLQLIQQLVYASTGSKNES